MKKNNPTLTSAWKNLTSHFNEIKNIEMKQMFADGKKAEDFTLNWEDFTVDFSKNRITKKTLGLLFNLASRFIVKDLVMLRRNELNLEL